MIDSHRQAARPWNKILIVKDISADNTANADKIIVQADYKVCTAAEGSDVSLIHLSFLEFFHQRPSTLESR